nr:hypothetical protein [Tanacetum cinerariifolium]
MHNNIMAAGLRDCPPMLAVRRYAQWRSRFLRYIDSRLNGDALKKCILKGKEIAKRITPPSESASKEDNDHEQAQRDKDMQKNLALIAKYFKKIYKPTNNNLSTSSNSKNKNVDTTPRKNVGSPIVQQTRIQCFNCKEFIHFAKEHRKPKRVKDSAYHKEKMLLCKQAEIGEVPTADSGTDSEPLEQVQYDAGYNMFANEIQHFAQSESISNTYVVETDDSNVIPNSLDMCDNDIQNDQNAEECDDEQTDDSNVIPNSLDMCDNDIQNDQNAEECDDERVALANLIANLKLDVDENKKIQKNLKKANTTLAQELTECKSILAKTSRTLGESNSIQDSCLVALQNKLTEFEKYKKLNNH